MDRQQQSIRYRCTNIDNAMSENILEIRTSRKLHRKNYAKRESRTDGKRANPNRGQNPKILTSQWQ